MGLKHLEAASERL